MESIYMKLFNKNKKKNIKLVMALLVASFLFGCSKKNNVYKRKDNYIYFGTYPQTKIDNNKLIDKLNKKSGSLPDASNLYNWKDSNYYIESNRRKSFRNQCRRNNEEIRTVKSNKSGRMESKKICI